MPTAAVNGTTLAYDDTGPRDGVPVVFGHSLFFDRTMFDDLVGTFARDHRVITYDHRGQGASAPDSAANLDMDTLTEDAAALIERLDLGPCHFVGNSMGGFVALRLAARRPDLLLSAAALGSSAEEEHRLEDFAPLVEHMREHGTAQVVDTLMHIMFGDTTLTAPERWRLRDKWRTSMLALTPAIGEAAHGVIHRGNIRSELAGTRVRVLALAGVEDHAYPPPLSSTAITEGLADGHAFEVPRAGHSVALEDPETVASYLTVHFASAKRD
jgi:3-oxoadipate enol-lactonase